MNKHRDPPTKNGPILRPAATGWQKWAEGIGGAWSLLGEAAELSELGAMPGSLIAVPVRRTFSLAVWVPADDPAIFRDLVLTQLEMRGLSGRTREDTSFAWREIVRQGQEVLLHVVVLPMHLAPRYWHEDVTAYAVSPDCLPLPADSVTIWREEGAWVAAVTRGEKLLHFQSLNESQPGEAMSREVDMMLLPFEAGEMIADRPSICFYLTPGEEIDLSPWSAPGGPVVTKSDFPAPIRPPKPLDCAPLPVREMQVRKARSARRQKFAFAGAAVYLCLVLLLAGQTLWLHWTARRLQAEIDRDAPAVAATREAMSRWQAMQPALEPATYPLEVIYQVAKLLPEDGVRFTLFDMNLERVVIQGEASTLAAAIKFADDVKKSASLGEFYEWTAENPKQLPNGSSRFQIDGTKRGSAKKEGNESSDI